MEFNSIIEKENGIIIKEVRNFELSHIFDCGQCFRWTRNTNNSYIGIANGKVIEVSKTDNDVIIENANEEDFKKTWANYFDLYRDYDMIKEILAKDKSLEEAIKFGNGIRILNQEPFETLISFIISSNNMIPRIKGSIIKISQRWGKEIVYKGNKFYTFPEPEDLRNATIEDLKECGTGFRAKYLYNTIQEILNCSNLTYDLDYIASLEEDACYKSLQSFMGVGPKVADCIMLFSMGKSSSFPVDVWVKRAMSYFYDVPGNSLKQVRNFAQNKFGELSGFAQQYLFYYVREKKII
jgi:N-glycosylase/DNA lyase